MGGERTEKIWRGSMKEGISRFLSSLSVFKYIACTVPPGVNGEEGKTEKRREVRGLVGLVCK